MGSLYQEGRSVPLLVKQLALELVIQMVLALLGLAETSETMSEPLLVNKMVKM